MGVVLLKVAGKKMDSDSGDDFVGSRRRKSSRPRKATLRQKLLEESGSSDGKDRHHLGQAFTSSG